VVVLDHHHRRQIVAMRRHAAHEQRVFLHQSKPRRRLPRPGHFAVPSLLVDQPSQPPRAGRYSTGPRQTVQSDSLAEQDVPHLAVLTVGLKKTLGF